MVEPVERSAERGCTTIHFTNTIHIDRTVGDVYGYLKDLENTPDWNWAVDETTKVSDGPIQVGTRFHQTRSVPTTSSEQLQITALEEDELIEVQGQLATFDALLQYRIKPDAGGTLLENEVDLTMPAGTRLLGGLVTKRIRESVASNLNDLKMLLESGI